MTLAPTITGKAIRLRPHRAEDMEAFWTFFQSPRAVYTDTPDTRTQLWYSFASEVGSWALTSMGGWAIETPDGQFAGQVAIIHPPHFAEPELGWILFDGFEGRGLAYDAARLALDYARAVLRPASLVSYIHADNTRSIALAKRLGASRDDSAKRHDAEDLVYRHAIQGGPQ
ncbi:GNAT family N-acetyltransferase [Halovulum sp. GXIMD14793]